MKGLDMRKVMALGLVVALCGYAFGEVKVTPITTTKPAPATVKADAAVNLETLIEKMPKELQPERGELSTRRKAREEWVKENIAPAARDKRGKENSARLVYAKGTVGSLHYDDKSDTLYLSVALKNQSNIGRVQLLAELPGEFRKDTISWKAGDSVTVSGKLVSFVDGNGTLADANVTSHEAKAEAPPNSSKKDSGSKKESTK